MPRYLMNTYAPMPVRIVRGDGVWLYDEQDRAYLDTISGIGVCSLGHSHPAVTGAIADQAGKLLHTANLIEIPGQRELGERLHDVTGMDEAFLCNSGTEAIECAIKLTRLHAAARGVASPQTIVFSSAFHGRSMGALTATHSEKAQTGFAPLLDGFIRAPYGDLDAVAEMFEQRSDVVAVMVEPVQGEGGVVVPPPGFISGLAELCRTHEALLVVDEIQTGLCKTGRWYAYQHYGVQPDVVATAKALGNGYPIGACLAAGRAAGLMQPGKHGSTFGGNPMACRVGCTVLDVMRAEALAEKAERDGEWLLAELRTRLGDSSAVKAIRGSGLMIGIEMTEPCLALKPWALKRGFILNVTRERVVRLLPPLVMDRREMGSIVDLLAEGVDALPALAA